MHHHVLQFVMLYKYIADMWSASHPHFHLGVWPQGAMPIHQALSNGKGHTLLIPTIWVIAFLSTKPLAAGHSTEPAEWEEEHKEEESEEEKRRRSVSVSTTCMYKMYRQ